MPLLAVHHVSYTYPQRTACAVKNVSVSFESGTYTAIAGLNGSGKSTLARILCGLLEPDDGYVACDKGAETALVFQSPKDQIVCGIVSRDTAFGPQNQGIPASEVELRTIECLNITGLLDKASSPSTALSLGQTQKEAIAGIIAVRPDILILDEAAAMLDPKSRGEIFRFLSYWVAQNHTVIHITHDIEAMKQAGRIILMESGSCIYDGTTEEFFSDRKLCSMITGPAIPACIRSPEYRKPVSFVAENLSFAYQGQAVLHGIGFSLQKGTLTALTGVSGSGKSTLLELAAGLLVPLSGNCRCEVRPVLAQQNSEAALFEKFAADDVAFGPRNRGMAGKELVLCVRKAMDEAGIPFDRYADRQTFCLSGGEKRRLAVAGIIALDVPVMLFDEPTAGLDGPSRFKVMQLLRGLAENGHTVLFSTHRRDEADFADREIGIMDGSVVHDTAGGIEAEPPLPCIQAPLEGSAMLVSLRSMTYGQAEKNTGIVAKLPSYIKIILFLSLFTISLAVRPLYLCIILFAVSLAYSLAVHFPVKRLAVSLLRTIPLLLFFCIFQMVFYPALPGEREYLSYTYFTVTPSKLLLCLTTLIHTEAALACIVSFSSTIPEYDVIDGLTQLLKPLKLLHVPVKYIIVIVEIIFRFIPLLIDEASSIIKTQLIRGGLGQAHGFFKRIKALIPLFVPLIIQTIKRAEALADALTERRFS